MSKLDDAIIYKYYVKGKLVFTSPLVLGCGEESNSDNDIIRNWNQKVFIPASGIAGPTRHYLDSVLEPDEAQENKLIRLIFGEKEKKSKQSLITFYDGDNVEDCQITIRDGVAIEEFTKTAEDKAKYNYEIMEPGATCRFRVELTIRGNSDINNDDLVSKCESVLFLVLDGFKNSNIRIGAKNARGFGEVKLVDAKILKLDLSKPDARETWVGFTWSDFGEGNVQIDGLTHTLKASQNTTNMKVEFNMPYSMLIRAPNPESAEEDVAHLSSKGNPVVSGTSWVGALRNAIIQVARDIDKLKEIKKLMEPLFGYAKKSEDVPNYEDRAQKSRIYISESVIENSTPLNYTRNKIDRFTGGALDTALFTEKATYGGQIHLTIKIFDAKNFETGLVLLGIKELWHGFQSVGGGANIGRGILSGLNLTLDEEKYDATDVSENFNNIFKKYITSLVGVLK